MDVDWYYTRAASIARKIYLNPGIGVGALALLCQLGLVPLRRLRLGCRKLRLMMVMSLALRVAHGPFALRLGCTLRRGELHLRLFGKRLAQRTQRLDLVSLGRFASPGDRRLEFRRCEPAEVRELSRFLLLP